MEQAAVELSWSTFVLEILNFLVLVWILKRFLYKPVLDVISRRRAGIEKTLADAEALRADAERSRQQYEGRLADWDEERRQAREALLRDLEAERALKMTELQDSLAQERQKAQVAETHRQADAMRKIEEIALMQGARFAARLLQEASGRDTEARLVDLVAADLAELPTDRISALRDSGGTTREAIVVASAFPLADDQRQRLEQALTPVTGPDARLRFEQNRELLAGVRIVVGDWILGMNLRDELQGFAELAKQANQIEHGDQHS
jgi:F-type H+-transporting ATPase subunit b